MAGVNTFEFNPIEETDVYKTILSISSHACGDDDLSLQMLIMCCLLIITYITHIVESQIVD